MIATEMTRAIAEKAQIDWATQIPLGRLGTVDEVAAAVVFSPQTRRRILQGTFWPSTAECTCRRIEWPYPTK